MKYVIKTVLVLHSSIMKVRIARLRDTESIARIHVDSWRAAYAGILSEKFLASMDYDKRLALWHKNVQENAVKLFVLEENKEVIGFSCIGSSRDSEVKGMELYAIYLDPAHQRKGKGTIFWNELEKFVRNKAYSVYLWVLKKNSGARAFYERNGFQEVMGKTKNLNIGGIDFSEVMYRKGFE